jgi:hypothetical protein
METGVFTDIFRNIGGYIPNLIGAVIILVVGWLAALLVSAALREVLKRTKLDNKIAKWIAGDESKTVGTEKWVPKGAFYLIMLFTLIAFFQALGLTMVTDPINRLLNKVFEFAPRIIGAGLLLLVAWIVASVLRALITKGLGAAKIDEKLGGQAHIEGRESLPVTSSLANAVYWLVFLFFLPAVLNALALEGLLAPVQGMIDNILALLPNIFAAAIILLIGWFIARIIRGIVVNLLSAAGVDRLSEKIGLAKAIGEKTLSGILGMLLYILILIPVAIAALDTLKIESISAPAKQMLQTALDAVPSIFAAVVIFIVAYIIGRLVCELVVNLLAGVGFNAILAKLGIGKETAEGKKTPSEIVGYAILIAIMLFAAMQASQILHFTTLAALISRFMVFAGQIVMGLIIFGIGLYLASIVAGLIEGTGSKQSGIMALAARVAIIILVSAMALRQMGLANDIITLAFSLLLGAIALALALAVGIGGKDIAAREVDKMISKMKGDKKGVKKS